MNTKILQRQINKNLLQSLNSKASKDTWIQEEIKKIISKHEKILIYSALPDEPNLDFIPHTFPYVEFYYPKIISKKEYKLDFILPVDWEQGKYGIREPRGIQKITAESLDLIILPALGYNSQGYRLGRGEGFYDRALSKVPKNRILGVTYSELFPSDFQEEAHDIRAGTIVTDKGAFFILDDY